MKPIAAYTIAETLFESRRSIIYRARRDADGRAVVLKVLNAEYPTIEQIARLHREYRLTRHLAMDGVIEALSRERYRSSVALVLEDFGGSSLASHLAGKPLALRPFLTMAIQLADVLGRIHKRRVIHKDVNPSNIVWNPLTGEVKIIDFGIAVELERETQAISSPSVLEGTLMYMSPEQTGRMNRAIDYRSDFYSLGVSFYQMLLGRVPFAASDSMELVHCHIAKVPTPPSEVDPGVPPPVSDILACLLEKRAEDRYQTASALKADLEHCLARLDAAGGLPSLARPRRDVSDRFQLPQHLYGREAEIDALLGAFERARRGEKQMMLVAGYSGVGKSALIHEVHRPIVAARGYFVSGKFDQFNRNIPYSSITQAFRELMRQLLTEPAEQLARWRERILAALGSNAQVIIDVIREVELIVGAQPPVPELPPREAQNRFNTVLEAFARAFAAEEHPLALFLDDLQWADLPSLQFIERLMTSGATSHTFLIGAYRDNEVDASHPLTRALDALRVEGAALSTITLRPLDRSDASRLLADALQRDEADVGELRDVCLRKTDGNPFFLGQFLLSLHGDGVFQRDGAEGRWTWDPARLSATQVTENVVDLMAAKMRRLPEETQRVLRLAAAIGNQFDLATLSVVDARPALETAEAVWIAAREGLVLPVGDGYKFLEDRLAAEELVSRPGGAAGAEHPEQIRYRFLHDRVQQAAYSLIPEDHRQQIHLQIGRLLLGSAGPAEREERLLEIVNHLDQGSALITSRGERDELAELNLAAGKRAKASAAHAAALRFTRTGIELLGDAGWERRHDMALALHLQAAEACLLLPDFEQMDAYADAALERSKDRFEMVRAYEIKIEGLTTQNKLAEAVRAARRILKLLGEEFPEAPTPADMMAALGEARAALGDRSIASLVDLPTMTDPEKLAAVRVLTKNASAAYLADPALFPLFAARQFSLALSHGLTGSLAPGFANYGILAGAVLGDIGSAYELSKLTTKVLERFGAREYEGRTAYTVGCMLRHWKEHARDNWRLFKGIYQVCMDTGDPDYAGYAEMSSVVHAVLIGNELGEIDREAAGHLQTLARIKHGPALVYAKLARQAAHNLMGRSADPLRLTGTEIEEGAALSSLAEKGDAYGLASAYAWKTQLCYLFGRHAEALENAALVEKYYGGILSQLNMPHFHLYEALALIAAYPGAPPGEQDRLRERILATRAKMKLWSEHGPMNHEHRHCLIEAEWCRVQGEPEAARRLYHRAMKLAGEHENVAEQALAAELLARFLEGLGYDEESAQLFMAKASHLYAIWGATAKVRDIEKRYPHIKAASSARTAREPEAWAAGTTTTAEEHAGALDLLSVLKASQAISREVVLPELLKTLLRLLIENAGARRGLLSLPGDRPLVIEADATSGDSVRIVPVAIEDRDDVALSVIRYVTRTHEAIVLADAASAGAFQADPYVARRRGRSILCQPVIHQQRMTGLLYLENELVANAFTPERCRVLDLLSTQAAISLENARVYETLDSRVVERTRELSQALQHLRDTQRQLITQENLASIGRLTAGIAHEIKNPLNFINNFARLSVELAEELVEELGQVPGSGGSGVAEIAHDLCQNMEKIETHGRRAGAIVAAMAEHSRQVAGEREDVDVGRLAEEYATLAYEGYRGRDRSIDVKIEVDLDASAPRLHVAPAEIGRVIQNLVLNAVYAAWARRKATGPAFAPLVRIHTREAGDHVEIGVRDNGAGIPAAIRDRVYTPFFTTKPAGEGAGLGLSISFDIVEQGYGGRLTFETEEGSFTEFRVRLPRRAAPGA